MLSDILSGKSVTNLLIDVFIYAIILLVCFPIHECAHALASKWLGDDTAQRQGRITLNPLAHLDLMGTIMMLLVGIGWAKPVETNPSRYTRKFFGKRISMKAGMAVTALAGPLSNIVLAYIVLIGTKIWYYTGRISLVQAGNDALVTNIQMALYLMITINCMLAVFNLLPIPPLDGSRILLVILKEKHYFGLMRYERYIMIGLMVFMFTGLMSGVLGFLADGLFAGLDFLSGYVELIFL